MNDPAPQPLALTVHTMQPPDLADPAGAERRRTRTGRLRMLLVLAVCAAPVVASYLAYYVFQPQGRSNYGAVLDPPRPWPAAMALVDLQGKAVAPATLAGQWLLVVVGPANCDAACERRLFTQRQLREMLGRERDRLDKVWLLAEGGPAAATASVAAGSAAPGPDIDPKLRRALEAAPPVAVLRAPRAALAAWLEPASGRALEDHLYLIDPRGQWVLRTPAEPDPARVKRDLDRLLRASASWDRAGR